MSSNTQFGPKKSRRHPPHLNNLSRKNLEGILVEIFVGTIRVGTILVRRNSCRKNLIRNLSRKKPSRKNLRMKNLSSMNSCRKKPIRNLSRKEFLQEEPNQESQQGTLVRRSRVRRMPVGRISIEDQREESVLTHLLEVHPRKPARTDANRPTVKCAEI